MSFNIPNIFVAGTKARADEVNENFSSLEEEINRRNGNISEIKSEVDYIKNNMLNDFVSRAEDISKAVKSRFSINYSNIFENEIRPDVLDFEENILKFKVGGIYPKLTGTNAFGESKTFESIENVDISGYSDGKYNVFVNLDNEIEIFNTKLLRTPYEPKNVVRDDVWFMPMETVSCYKFSGISWVEYRGIPLGSIVIESGQIKSVENSYFNRQYLDSDCIFLTPDGRKGISKRYESDWFIAAPSGTYTFEHNLNLDPLRYRARLVSKVKEDFSGYKAGDIIETVYSNHSTNELNKEFGYILKFTRDTVTLGVGNSEYHTKNDFGQSGFSNLLRSNVELKIIITQDVN